MPGPLVRLVGRCGDSLGFVRQRPGWLNSDKMAEASQGHGCAHPQGPYAVGWSPAVPWTNACAKRPDVSPGRVALSLRAVGSCVWPTACAGVGQAGVFPPREESQIKPGPGRAQHGTGNQVNATCCLVPAWIQMPRHQSQLRLRTGPRSPRCRPGGQWKWPRRRQTPMREGSVSRLAMAMRAGRRRCPSGNGGRPNEKDDESHQAESAKPGTARPDPAVVQQPGRNGIYR